MYKSVCGKDNFVMMKQYRAIWVSNSGILFNMQNELEKIQYHEEAENSMDVFAF